MVKTSIAAVSVANEEEIRDQDRARVARLRASNHWTKRLALMLTLVGPGILVMIADNDAGGVVTYAQTGAMYGAGFFVPAIILGGFIAFAVQEMTVRLGAVTHRGHAEMIWGRYGPFWGWFSLVDLVAANVLTLITEFIGITVGMSVFGVAPVWSAAAALALDASILLFLRYYAWERVSLWVALGNLGFVPLALMAHPRWTAVATAIGHLAIPGGVQAAFLFVVLANFGTTIAPWMLFFQQSCVVDKGLTVQDVRHGQWDTAIGSLFMVMVAVAILLLSATLMSGHSGPANDRISQIIAVVGRHLGTTGQDLFALGLVEAGTIATIALTASTSWAMGEAFGWPKSINLPAKVAWRFYIPGLFGAVLAAAVVLIPHAPLGFLNLTVQVVASIFMPAALLFLLLLLNDRGIMGVHVNRPWQNIVAVSIIGILVILNGMYGVSVVVPKWF